MKKIYSNGSTFIILYTFVMKANWWKGWKGFEALAKLNRRTAFHFSQKAVPAAIRVEADLLDCVAPEISSSC